MYPRYTPGMPDLTIHNRDSCMSGFQMSASSNYSSHMEIETHMRYVVPTDFPTSLVQAVSMASSRVISDIIEEFRMLNENPHLIPLKINDPLFKDMIREKLSGKRR